MNDMTILHLAYLFVPIVLFVSILKMFSRYQRESSKRQSSKLTIKKPTGMYYIDLDQFEDHPVFKWEISRVKPQGNGGYYAGYPDKGMFKDSLWSLYQYRIWKSNYRDEWVKQPWYYGDSIYQANGYRITFKREYFISDSVKVELVMPDGSTMEVKDPAYEVPYTDELAEIFYKAVKVMCAIYTIQHDIVSKIESDIRDLQKQEAEARKKNEENFVKSWKNSELKS